MECTTRHCANKSSYLVLLTPLRPPYDSAAPIKLELDDLDARDIVWLHSCQGCSAGSQGSHAFANHFVELHKDWNAQVASYGQWSLQPDGLRLRKPKTNKPSSVQASCASSLDLGWKTYQIAAKRSSNAESCRSYRNEAWHSRNTAIKARSHEHRF